MMDLQNKENFLKFYRNKGSSVSLIILGIVMILFGLVLASTEGILAVLIFCGTGLLLVGSMVYDSVNGKKYIKGIEESGEINSIVHDFANAPAHVNGSMKLGSSYVFCKGCKPVLYSQIGKVYQKINKRNGVETNRFLILEDSNSRQLGSVSLKLKGKSDNELSAIMLHLISKNPGIHLGY